MRQLGLCWLIVLFFFLSQSVALAAEAKVDKKAEGVFYELWNNAAFKATNLENNNFSSVIGRFEGKVGVDFFDLPAQLYGVYYGVASQNTEYWNNSIYAGVGARCFPLRQIQRTHWLNEWLPDTRLFVENLSASYLKNASSAEALAKQDVQYGLEVWHEWNQEKPERRLPWGELWLKVTHRDTNFGWEPFHTYVMSLQPRLGLHLGEMVKPYLLADITYSRKEGPSYYFLNTAAYGLGVRFEPWRESEQAENLFRKFKMFAEIVSISYLKDKPLDLTKEVSHDVRFGVEFSYGR